MKEEIINYINGLDLESRNDFRNAVNSCMEFLSLNDRQCSRLFGVSVPTIKRWRKGESSPHPFVREMVMEEFAKQVNIMEEKSGVL